MRRPSASVFPISTVLPLRVRTMSRIHDGEQRSVVSVAQQNHALNGRQSGLRVARKIAVQFHRDVAAIELKARALRVKAPALRGKVHRQRNLSLAIDPASKSRLDGGNIVARRH
jgi:hypothetical protein